MELNHGSLEHDRPLHVFCPVLAVGFQGLHSGDRWNGGMERLRPKAVQAYEEHLEWRKMSHVQELLKVTRQGRADMSDHVKELVCLRGHVEVGYTRFGVWE